MTGRIRLVDERSLIDVCADARMVSCGHCDQRPGLPCVFQTGTAGYHLARFARAFRRGLLSNDELAAVLYAEPIFTNGTVIYEPAAQS
jgi:hypothetical protein